MSFYRWISPFFLTSLSFFLYLAGRKGVILRVFSVSKEDQICTTWEGAEKKNFSLCSPSFIARVWRSSRASCFLSLA